MVTRVVSCNFCVHCLSHFGGKLPQTSCFAYRHFPCCISLPKNFTVQFLHRVCLGPHEVSPVIFVYIAHPHFARNNDPKWPFCHRLFPRCLSLQKIFTVQFHHRACQRRAREVSLSCTLPIPFSWKMPQAANFAHRPFPSCL